MIQLKVLSGKTAGTEHVARRFPFHVGRAASAHLRLEEDGVWDRHLELVFDAATGIVMRTHGDALVAVNGQPCREVVLRNGDELALGALKLRFWIGPTRQAGMHFREWLTWLAFVLIAAGQLVLIYRLTP